MHHVANPLHIFAEKLAIKACVLFLDTALIYKLFSDFIEQYSQAFAEAKMLYKNWT